MDKKRRLLILTKNKYGSFTISGKSFKYNQLVTNGNFVNSSNWNIAQGGTLTIENNKAIVTTNGNNQVWIYQSIATTLVVNHKYYVCANVKSSVSCSFWFVLTTNYSYQTHSISANTKSFVDEIATVTSGGANYLLGIRFNSGTDVNNATIEFENVMLIDLTLLYGAGNEPTTVNAFNETELGQIINTGFYLPTNANNVIYNAETPFNFVDKTFTPTTNFYLRGIFGTNDTYENVSGIITRKIGVIDLGTLVWFSEGDNWYGQVPNAKGMFGINGHTQLCAKYKNADDLSENMTCRFGYTSININIHDTSLVGLTDVQVAQALSGVLLYYELDSDTTASAESVSLKKSTNKCYDTNGLELTII